MMDINKLKGRDMNNLYFLEYIYHIHDYNKWQVFHQI